MISRDLNRIDEREEEAKRSGYTQVFTDGIIEATNSMILRRRDEEWVGFWTMYEAPEATVPEYIGFIYSRGGSPPFFVYLSFLDANGYQIVYRSRMGSERNSSKLDHQVATLPVVTVESNEIDSEEVTKEMMRNVWHAFGNLGDAFERVQTK